MTSLDEKKVVNTEDLRTLFLRYGPQGAGEWARVESVVRPDGIHIVSPADHSHPDPKTGQPVRMCVVVIALLGGPATAAAFAVLESDLERMDDLADALNTVRQLRQAPHPTHPTNPADN